MQPGSDGDGGTRAGRWVTGPKSYFRSVSSDIHQLPGSGGNAHRSVAELVHSALDRVRASILSRS